MKGMIIGGPGVFHIYLAMFAIGGGMLMCYFQYLAQNGKLPYGRQFVDKYFKLLVLISFVVGAVTGVAMWFTSIQVSPRTIGVMVFEFHWIWAVEWTFFCLEIASGYCFYRYGERLSDPVRLRLLGIYSIASWFSLFWINGILSWQLTPGAWTEGASVYAGFFNPSFFPSLFYRTISAMTIASLAGCLVINFMSGVSRKDKTVLMNRSANFLLPMLLMPFLGVWFLWSMPEDARAMAMGASVVMNLFLGISILASALIGVYAVVGMFGYKLYINAATAALLCMLAFGATFGGEFVREGVRKPFTIRRTLYSNSVKPAEVALLRREGCVKHDLYPLIDEDDYPTEQLKLGAKVYRFHCSVCHTIDGANALVHLAGSWSDEQKRLNIAQLQKTKTFMPPFAGTAEELESVVQLISWRSAGSPAEWEETGDEELYAWIKQRIDEAGIEPGYKTAAHASVP